jgi:hypothetical protein
MKALTRSVLVYGNTAERYGDALKLQKLLQTFELVLTLVVLTKVPSAINAASTCLQSKDADLFTESYASFEDSIR